MLPWLSRSFIKLDANPLSPLLIQVSTLLQERDSPIYIQHVRSHSPLPGLLSEGNALADQTTSTGTFVASTEQADQFHSLTQTNIKGIHNCFPHTPHVQLQRIIKSYSSSSCASLITTPTLQMMDTHTQLMSPVFLNLVDRNTFLLSYLHFIWATVQTGKNSKRLIHHMLSTFAIMGIPQQIKTDNGPAFTSSQFKTFCTHWEIVHHTGIPHNPQGQGK